MHRAAVESIFGLRQGAQELSFTPCLPSTWPRAELTLRRDGRALRFILVRATAETALAMAGAPAGAQLLRLGQALNWAALTTDACFVIPLTEGVTTVPRGGVLQRETPAADGRSEPAFLQS
jgi:cyclic beta-1,2-glucan synthetase